MFKKNALQADFPYEKGTTFICIGEFQEENMGSFTTLGIGNIEIDWQKNHIQNNHSPLFQSSDFKEVERLTDDEQDPDAEEYIYEKATALVRTLGKMKRRLELLGYSMRGVEQLYKDDFDNWEEYYSEKPPIPYDKFLELVMSFDLKGAKPSFNYDDFDPGEFASSNVFVDTNFIDKSISISKDEGLFFENLNPYVALRLIAENNENHDFEVTWDYDDLIQGGWINKEDVYTPLDAKSKFIIVTEGSSDTYILKKAISFLAPDVSDFFTFIDMKDNYPFSGTGSLLNFCKGLASIQVQNKMLVIYDNDVAGIRHCRQAQELNLPLNMKVVTLPNNSAFNEFKTIGTEGDSNSDINGKAVAIECFLDLFYKLEQHKQEPRIRWKNYDDELNSYHGALEFKETYMRKFMECDLSAGGYDLSKLCILVDFVISNCAEIATLERMAKNSSALVL